MLAVFIAVRWGFGPEVSSAMTSEGRAAAGSDAQDGDGPSAGTGGGVGVQDDADTLGRGGALVDDDERYGRQTEA